MIENVHERELAVPVSAVSVVLDGLAVPGVSVWPAPPWHPLVLDRPLGVGADGGHGPVRYVCTRHVPGRAAEFTFHPSSGLDGTHTFTVLEGPDRCVLRHVIRGRPRGLASRLRWSLVIRWLHDALLEDLFDRVATAVGVPPPRPARWSPWVRLLMATVVRVEARAPSGA